MSIRNKFALGAVVCFIGAASVGISTSVLASDAGAFIGGVFATKIIGNVRRQTDAQEVQAAAAVQQSQSSTQKSPQQRLQELDTLAAKGYITQQEYKTKKQSILDAL